MDPSSSPEGRAGELDGDVWEILIRASSASQASDVRTFWATLRELDVLGPYAIKLAGMYLVYVVWCGVAWVAGADGYEADLRGPS